MMLIYIFYLGSPGNICTKDEKTGKEVRRRSSEIAILKEKSKKAKKQKITFGGWRFGCAETFFLTLGLLRRIDCTDLIYAMRS